MPKNAEVARGNRNIASIAFAAVGPIKAVRETNVNGLRTMELEVECQEVPRELVDMIQDNYGELADHLVMQLDNAAVILALLRGQQETNRAIRAAYEG